MSRKKIIFTSALFIAILTCSYFVAANYGFFSGGTNAPSVPEDTMTRGLVGYWEFEEGTGQTVYDISGNGNDGTLGASASSASDDPKWGAGKNGGGMEFDGVDDYVDAGSGSSLDVTDAITIEAWIKTGSDFSLTNYIFSNLRSYQTSGYSFDKYQYGGGLRFRGGNGSAGDNLLSGDLTWDTNTWYHIAVSYNNLVATFYRDGVNVGSDTMDWAGSIGPHTNNHRIGVEAIDTSPFNGSIDSVRIYNRALSADEVRYHYNRGGPVGSWNFDEGSGTTANDGTENNNDGTLKSSGLEFDGVNDYVDAGSNSITGTSPFTIAGWLKLDTHTTWGLAVYMGTEVIGQAAWIGWNDTANAIGGGFWNFNMSSGIADNDWHYVVLTFGGGAVGNVRLYVDGTQKSSTTYTPNLGSDTTMFGRDGGANGFWYDGSIDEVRIYDTALSPEEIARQYNGDFSQDPTGNLVLLQHFEEGMACDANDEVDCLTDDSSGGVNDGTLKNFDNLTTWDNGTDGWISEVKKPEWRWVNGKYKTAGEFNGWDDYVEVASNPSLEGLSALTLAAWINPTGEPGIDLGRIIHKAQGATGDDYALSHREGTVFYSNEIAFRINTDSGVTTLIGNTPVIPNTGWHHVVGVWDGSNMEIFLNAVSDGTVSRSGTIDDSNESMGIGGHTASATRRFNGSIDDVRIYPYARTADEIRLDYNAGVATHLGPSDKTCSEDPAGCLDYGLVGSWGMDEGTGQYAYDASDEGNDGTLGASASSASDDPRWTTDSPPFQGGAGGGSLSFDGVDDYVNAGSGASLDNLTSFSYSAWIKMNNFNSTYNLIAGKNDHWEKGFFIDSSARLRGYIAHSTTAAESNSAFNFIIADTWYYTVMVFDENTKKISLYLDGNEISYGTQTAGVDGITHYSNNNLRIGGSSGYKFNGSIDSVRIYNRALSAEEVRYHYNKGGPVAEWRFDEGSGQTVFDGSFNNNDGTLGATPAVEASDPTWVEGKYGGALSFNGGDDYVDTTDLDDIDGATQLSGSAWIKLNNLDVDGAIFAKDAWHDTSQLLLWRDDEAGVSGRTNTFTMLVSDGINLAKLEGDTGQLNDYNWHFLSFSFIAASSTGLRVYVDGVEDPNSPVSTSSITALKSTSNIFRIGQVVPDFSGKYFNGSIDSVNIYNYARTADEIRLDYNAGVATHLGPSGKTCSEDPAGCVDYGLVGSWGMDEGTGQYAYDASDEGNDGTLGASASSASDDPRWTTDSSPLAGGGGSLKFDGVDDYVPLSSDITLSTNFSFCVWAKKDDLTSSGGLLGWTNLGGVRYFNINGDYAVAETNTNGQMIYFTDPTISDNNWHYYCVVINSGNYSTYLDGNLNNTGSASGDLTLNQIGRGKDINYFHGSIDSVRIYNRVLSAEEVRYHYNKSGPVAEWKFDEGEGTTAYDSSINRNNGTLTNMASPPTSSSGWGEGKYGSGLVFDGSNDYVDCGNVLNFERTDPFSITAWVKSTDTSGVIVGNSDSSSPYRGYALQMSSKLEMFLINDYVAGNRIWVEETASGTVNDGNWHQVSMTYTGSSSAAGIKLYMDGQEIATTTQTDSLSTTIVSSVSLTIGKKTDGGSEIPLDGSIDDVRIYNYARTPSQIQQDYNAGVATHFR